MDEGKKDEATPLDPPTMPPASAPLNPPKKAADTVSGSAPTGDSNVSAPGQFFGEYELLAELGRGGMGVVFKALQQNLNRVVALKMVLSGSLSKPEEVRRFRTEAESTACLRHPHIVTVHTVGERDGCHYFSMDFIDGPSLAQRLSAGPLPGRVAARYLITIARAIHHAHEHGILHRDLKPSNILFDSTDQPHVTDFGLAKRFGGDCRHTRTGSVMGTPSYMSPEQAAGRNKDLSPACDVYGLGALLYEMLTGRPPFRAETPLDTMLQVIEREPAPPRLLNPKIDRDLEMICLKCLEKEPRRRYKSGEELAKDLERFLNGDSISARSFNLVDRLARTLERSQYDVEFRSYGTMLLAFAPFVILLELTVTFLIVTRQSSLWLPVAQLSRIAFLGVLYWRFRPKGLRSANTAERQMWSVWIGYIVACTVIAIAYRLQVGWAIEKELDLYPFLAAATGLAFFVMGSSYWGWCYAFGASFFGLALLMTADPAWGPIEFGTLWAVSLSLIGLRLRGLAAETGGHLDTDHPSATE
jgi:serine/threonine-protein kinase